MFYGSIQKVKPNYIAVIDDGSSDYASHKLNEKKDKVSDSYFAAKPDLEYNTQVNSNFVNANYERLYADTIVEPMDQNRNYLFVSNNHNHRNSHSTCFQTIMKNIVWLYSSLKIIK